MSLTSNALKKLQEEGQLARKSNGPQQRDNLPPSTASSDHGVVSQPSSPAGATTDIASGTSRSDASELGSQADPIAQPVEDPLPHPSADTQTAVDPCRGAPTVELPDADAHANPQTIDQSGDDNKSSLLSDQSPAEFEELDKVTAELELLAHLGPEAMADFEREGDYWLDDHGNEQEKTESLPVDASLDEAWDELTALANAKSLEQEVREMVTQDGSKHDDIQDSLARPEPLPERWCEPEDEPEAYIDEEIVVEPPQASDYDPIIPSIDDLLDDVPELRFDADDTISDCDTPTGDAPSIRFAPTTESELADFGDKVDQDTIPSSSPLGSDGERPTSPVSDDGELAVDEPVSSDAREPHNDFDESQMIADDDTTVPVEVSPLVALTKRRSLPTTVKTAEIGQVSPFEQRVAELLSLDHCRDELQQLLATMEDRCQPQFPQRLLVTSAVATSRTADVLGILAVELSKRGEKILLIDSNLRDQVITRSHEALGMSGLCDVLADSESLDAVVRPSGTEGVFFVASGDDTLGISREPSLLHESRLVQVLRHWEEQFDRILIDGGASDSAMFEPLARNTQAAILLVAGPQIDHSHLRRAAQRLADASAFVVGCLLTDFPSAPKSTTASVDFRWARCRRVEPIAPTPK